MKIGDAAKYLGVHPITLKRLEKLGVIRPVRDRNGWRRLNKEDVEKARAYLFPRDNQNDQDLPQ
jgi:excisionase family DNA binding protein